MFTRRLAPFHNHGLRFGAVAQLIERLVRNEEVVGLIPIRSTKPTFNCPRMDDNAEVKFSNFNDLVHDLLLSSYGMP